METYEEIPEEWRKKSIKELEEIRDRLYNKLERLPRESQSFREHFQHQIHLIELYLYYRQTQENPELFTSNDIIF